VVVEIVALRFGLAWLGGMEREVDLVDEDGEARDGAGGVVEAFVDVVADDERNAVATRDT
jgi:hypothetical protein